MSWNSRERRQFIRLTVPCTVEIIAEPVLVAKTWDISAGGIRIILPQRLANSSIIQLRIHNLTESAIETKGRIRWIFTRHIPSIGETTLYDTGIEFYRIKRCDSTRIKTVISNTLSGKFI